MNETSFPDRGPDARWPNGDRAAPMVRKLGDTVAAAGRTLHAKSDQLRDTGDEWAEGVRTTVRSRPLLSVFAAFALGALIARIPR